MEGSPLVVAEIGEFPRDWPELVRIAKAAGADAVKVQLWRAYHFPAGEKKRADEFPRDQFETFCDTARWSGLLAGASVFDLEAARLCARYGDFIKLATREQHNLRLRIACFVLGQFYGLPVFRSYDVRGSIPRRWPGEIPMACVPEYPARTWVSNLPPPPFGWSSHTDETADCLAAAVCGAAVIEKHLSPTGWPAWTLGQRRFAMMVRELRWAS